MCPGCASISAGRLFLARRRCWRWPTIARGAHHLPLPDARPPSVVRQDEQGRALREGAQVQIGGNENLCHIAAATGAPRWETDHEPDEHHPRLWPGPRAFHLDGRRPDSCRAGAGALRRQPAQRAATTNCGGGFAAFSIHKTAGVAVLIIALARILWTLSQIRPRPLYPSAGWRRCWPRPCIGRCGSA